jgi:hypothetical protein
MRALVLLTPVVVEAGAAVDLVMVEPVVPELLFLES